jgi:hypothetical protein
MHVLHLFTSVSLHSLQYSRPLQPQVPEEVSKYPATHTLHLLKADESAISQLLTWAQAKESSDKIYPDLQAKHLAPESSHKAQFEIPEQPHPNLFMFSVNPVLQVSQ